jgi:hypothetical protein
LGEDLQAEGVQAQLFVVGGAAMALAFNTRRLTRDVDGVFEPKSVIYAAARRVADRHEGLAEDWLNPNPPIRCGRGGASWAGNAPLTWENVSD